MNEEFKYEKSTHEFLDAARNDPESCGRLS